MKKKTLKLHLHPRPRSHNGKSYVYYALAQSYRDDNGKPQKKIFAELGALSDLEVAEWKLRLNYFSGDIFDLTRLSELQFVDSKRYLDVAVMSAVYDQLKLNDAFAFISEKEVKAHDIAKILTISRCLEPQANYKTVDWFKNSYLPQILNINPEKYNKDKIFRETIPIHQRRSRLQQHLTMLSNKFRNGDFELYFFDTTTSFFEGTECMIAQAGLEKTTHFQDKVVMIGLVTDKQGYPIAWDVFPGNKSEKTEFKKIAKNLCENIGIREATFCFDRGIATISNFELIENEEGLDSKFISGIYKNQIQDVFDLTNFINKTRPSLIQKYHENIQQEAAKTIKPIDGFYRLGKSRFYRDLGVIDGRRYVVSFNFNIYEKEKETRAIQLNKFKKEVQAMNDELAAAKGDREFHTIEKDLDTLLSKNHLTKIVEYTIIPKAVGTKAKPVQSFEIKYVENIERLMEAQKYDGILVYITNHIELTAGRYIVSAGDIVSHYKDKFVIENAFRYLKSFEDLRPFFVRLDEHVQAHVDICMAGYFINTFLYYKLKEIGLSLNAFYEQIKKYSMVAQLETRTGNSICLLKKLPKELQQVISHLKVDYVLNKEVLERYKIKGHQ